MRKFLFGCFILGTALVCRADEPVCTGDRHYDGVACCYSETTTTTLPDNDGCPTVICPEIPACPDVVCGSGDTTYNITVNRCPAQLPPAFYHQCKKTKRHGIVCPSLGHPRRVFVPSIKP